MKTWKLVSGILSIVLSVFVLFQSALAGVANTMSANGEAGGSAGLFVAILLLAGGIVSICVRKSVKKGGNIALVVLFGLAALFGFVSKDFKQIRHNEIALYVFQRRNPFKVCMLFWI